MTDLRKQEAARQASLDAHGFPALGLAAGRPKVAAAKRRLEAEAAAKQKPAVDAKERGRTPKEKQKKRKKRGPRGPRKK